MAEIFLPSFQGAKDLKEVTNQLELMRKELEYILSSLDVSNMNKNYVSVIESGDTANGYYRKFSDGTMDCYFTNAQQTDTATWTLTPVSGITYYSTGGYWVFPKPFLAGTTVNVMASGDIGQYAPETHTAWHFDNTQCRIESGMFGKDPRTPAVAMRVSYFARGFWR